MKYYLNLLLLLSVSTCTSFYCMIDMKKNYGNPKLLDIIILLIFLYSLYFYISDEPIINVTIRKDSLFLALYLTSWCAAAKKGSVNYF